MTVLGLFQSYRLPGPPADGQEVCSLIRQSRLASPEYIDSFFDTGDEVQRVD